MTRWLTSAFGYPITKKPIGDAGALPLLSPTSIVLHTTQGVTDEGANGTFSGEPGISPHFTMDSDSIYQLRSLEHRAGSLKGDTTNDPYAVQIEMAAICTEKPWKLPKGAFDRAAALVARISKELGIPLVRPNSGWKDNCSDMPLPWATTSNSRRKWAEKDGRWPSIRGVWQHLEIPLNDHWDCGALNISELVTAAAALLVPAPPPEEDFMTSLSDKDQERLLQGVENLMSIAEQTARRHSAEMVDAAGHPYVIPIDSLDAWPKGALDKLAEIMFPIAP